MFQHLARAGLLATSLAAFLLSISACQEQAPDPPYRSRTAGQTQPATNSTQNTADSNTPAAGQGTQTPTGSAPALPSARAEPLNDTQATGLIRGSCIYAGCHADITALMASANILPQLRDSLMPPPTQQRYTLRSEDRAALVSYFQTKSSTTP